MSEDRISKLSQRFRTHAVGRKPTSDRKRKRHSLYCDEELVEQLWQAYGVVNHEIYPNSVNKATFLEALIEYGLENLEDIKSAISQSQEAS